MKIEHRLPTVQEYQELRSFTGWWSVDSPTVELALSNSIFSVVAVEQDSVIGFARIVGDGGLYFYIQDLIVHPNFRSQQVGTALVKELMNFIKTSARSGAFVGLMAAKGLEKYYNEFGFTARDKTAPGMFQIIK